MDESRLAQIEKSIEDIKTSQDKIAHALLGSYEKNSVGLIEEARNLRRDVDESKHRLNTHDVQITEFTEFRSDAKKIVAGIAIVIPFIFELVKFGFSFLWDMIKPS
jgi:hypothetical protein